MTEAELRNKVVDTFTAWLGLNEKDGSFQKILDVYNSQETLPRGYRMKATDEWCAATVSAIHILCGTTAIAPTECSCYYMVEEYKALGRWVEDDGYRPQIGDTIFYYWKDDGVGDCTGAPNHVGIVAKVNGTVLTIIEGNKGEAVAYRTIQVDGRYIRGYGIPDYASMAESEVEEVVTYDQWKEFMTQYRTELQDNDCGDWSQEAREWAVNAGIITGGGEINGLPNYMWQDLSTREQLIVVLYRFAKSIGQA